MKISVITPVWNRADLTMRFLMENWRQYSGRPDVEFILVDNGSTDNTRAVLLRWAETMQGRLIRIHNDENRGFGPGHNQGAQVARGELLVFLSNDVGIRGDYLGPLEDRVAMEGGALFGAELLAFDTGWNTFDGQTIPYLGGWFVAATVATWEKLGGWDERFIPCDYEDLDLSYAAMQKGMTLVHLELPLAHAFGQSAQRLAGGRRAVTEANRARFMEKWGFRD